MVQLRRYVVLLRGINVGGRNKIAMSKLKLLLEEQGFADVVTYLQSGNVLVSSPLSAKVVGNRIEQALGKAVKFDTDLIRILALGAAQFRAIVDKRPKGFGDEPGKYHSDAIFMMGISVKQALTAFSPREDVDRLWPGRGVIYHQRLSAKRTKTRLNRMMASPLYLSMTIRSWQTVLKLLEMTR